MPLKLHELLWPIWWHDPCKESILFFYSSFFWGGAIVVKRQRDDNKSTGWRWWGALRYCFPTNKRIFFCLYKHKWKEEKKVTVSPFISSGFVPIDHKFFFVSFGIFCFCFVSRFYCLRREILGHNHVVLLYVCGCCSVGLKFNLFHFWPWSVVLSRKGLVVQNWIIGHVHLEQDCFELPTFFSYPWTISKQERMCTPNKTDVAQKNEMK